MITRMDPPNIITLVSSVETNQHQFKFRFHNPLNYSNDFYTVGLRQVFHPPNTKGTSETYNLIIDCIRPYLVYPSFSQVLRVLDSTTKNISYDNPIFFPLNRSVLNEINIRFEDHEGAPVTFSSDKAKKVGFVLEFKRIPYGRLL